VELKQDIENSEYKEMFDFSIYNSWIKKQITIPLEQIKTLLEKNLKVLNNQKQEIQDLLKIENDSRKS
jgi:hypothetical protein